MSPMLSPLLAMSTNLCLPNRYADSKARQCMCSGLSEKVSEYGEIDARRDREREAHRFIG